MSRSLIDSAPLHAAEPNRTSMLSRDALRGAASTSYVDVLKSSALIGGASILNLLIGMIRTKALALLLGPAGFGLFGLYGSLADVARSLAGFGINSSGVRQIADAVASGDSQRIARTAFVLRRMALILGALGTCLLVVFAPSISLLTFGSSTHASAVALLSLVVLLGLVAEAQAALIQGTRRIARLAKAGVLASFLGASTSIPVVYWLREDGVVPSLIAVAAMSVVTFWWYSRNLFAKAPRMRATEITHEAASLLKFGLAFMASGFLMMGTSYAVRTMVLGNLGLEAAGYYHAAWTLGGLYVGFVLQAMGADFYPRLVGVAWNNLECNRMVNEQTQVSLLLSGPGVLATLVFASTIVTLLYSDRFHPAVDVLRWVCLGMALRVSSWPMGFIIIAKGRQTVFFLAELAWTLVSLCLAWACLGYFGLAGAGIAFFGSYVFHWVMIYAIVNRLSGFRWSASNARTILRTASCIAVVFAGFHELPAAVAGVLGAMALIASSVHSIRALSTLVAPGGARSPIPRALATILLRARNSGSAAAWWR